LTEEAAKDKRSVTNYLEMTLPRFWEDIEAKAERKSDKTSRD
jgi:hypothetical protein